MMELFWAFLKIGAFAFGGAYGAIPLIRDTVLSHGWMDAQMFANLTAVAESTPGPIMVNLATYVGAAEAGLPGALAATLGVVLPSFVLILLVSAAFRSLLGYPAVRAALQGIKPCLAGLILAARVGVCSDAVFSRGSAGPAAPAVPGAHPLPHPLGGGTGRGQAPQLLGAHGHKAQIRPAQQLRQRRKGLPAAVVPALQAQQAGRD
mgnify:CR=1 FL=1